MKSIRLWNQTTQTITSQSSWRAKWRRRWWLHLAIGSGGQQPEVDVEIDGVTIHALIDSGAQISLIDQATFESLPRKPTLEPAKGKLYAYQTDKPISVKSQFNATVHANGHKTEASFKVVDGWVGNLLSFAKARQFDRNVINNRVGRLKEYSVRFHIDESVAPVKSPYRRKPYHMI